MYRKITTTALSLVLLFSAQCLQAAPSPGFNFDTAFPSPLSGAYTGSTPLPDVSSPSNIAWFQFSLAGPSNVELDTFNSAVTDTVLALYDSSGLIKGQNDDCSNPSSAQSCLSLTNLAMGTYLAGVLKYTSIFDPPNCVPSSTTTCSTIESEFINMWEATLSSNAGDEGVTLNINISAVPVPAAVWLFGTALIGFVGMSRRTSVKS